MTSSFTLPPPVKILKFFTENECRRLAIGELKSIVDESEDGIQRILEGLVKRGLLAQEGRLYYYEETPQSRELADKILKVYEKARKPPKEEIFKELVSNMSMNPYSLEKRLIEEGFTPEEAEELMVKELDKFVSEKMPRFKTLHGYK
ncbi:MAG: hypothetical protein SVK08_08715 [Halobacteriota archaeon]|nr:hypothetical protein [Halobacteriota archaeon]